MPTAQAKVPSFKVSGALKRLNRGCVKLLIGLIHFYQQWLSPFLGRQCRFHPTCSCYAEQALAQRGITKGLALALWRLLRCQPFARGGFDPVPTPISPTQASESDLHVTH